MVEKHALSVSEKEYFSMKESWIGGPIFELKLVFETGCNGSELTKFIINKFCLLLWSGALEDKNLRTISKIEKNFCFGLEHSFYTSKLNEPHFLYVLGIRPPQLVRLVKYYPDSCTATGENEWQAENKISRIDKSAFNRIIDFYSSIACKIAINYPLLFGTISDEDGGYANPKIKDIEKGLYLDKNLDKILSKRNSQQLEYRKNYLFQKFNE